MTRNMKKLILSPIVIFLATAIALPAHAQSNTERYEGVSRRFLATIEDMEKDHQDLIDQWVEARDLMHQLVEQLMVLGAQERRQAEMNARLLERNFTRAQSRFLQMMERTRRPYDQRLDRMNTEIWRRQNMINPDHHARAEELRNEVFEMREQTGTLLMRIRTMEDMKSYLDRDLPGPPERLRFNVRSRDIKRHYDLVSSQAPRLLDARFEVLDYLADVQRLNELKSNNTPSWTQVQERELENALEEARGAWQNLERQLARQLRNELRQEETVKRNIETLQARMERASDRMRERISGQLQEEELDLAQVQGIIAGYRLVLVFPSEFESPIRMLDMQTE